MLMIAADNAEEVRIDEAKMTDKTVISSDKTVISSDKSVKSSENNKLSRPISMSVEDR